MMENKAEYTVYTVGKQPHQRPYEPAEFKRHYLALVDALEKFDYPVYQYEVSMLTERMIDILPGLDIRQEVLEELTGHHAMIMLDSAQIRALMILLNVTWMGKPPATTREELLMFKGGEVMK